MGVYEKKGCPLKRPPNSRIILTVLNRDHHVGGGGGGTTFTIKDSSYKGGHPKV